MNKAEYSKYLCSREWALKKEAVKKRSNGICERCKYFEAEQVHHLTYERIGNESLADLLHICPGCHEFLSAKSDIDPVAISDGFFAACAMKEEFAFNQENTKEKILERRYNERDYGNVSCDRY